MKIVIQCAGRKQSNAGRLSNGDKKVVFVMKPVLAKAIAPGGVDYFRPDDQMPGSGKTWIQILEDYNSQKGNPDELLEAIDLYVPEAYGEAKQFGNDKGAEIFILSAGWGLVRGSFRLPDYDITFSSAQNVKEYAKREVGENLPGLNHIGVASEKEETHFFGGRDYLPLFYSLTEKLCGRKIVHHRNGTVVEERVSYEYSAFTPSKPKQKTNWHYGCLRSFMANNGHLSVARL